MAEVANATIDGVDRRKEKSTEDDPGASSPIHQQQQPQLQPNQVSKRPEDGRERRDDRDSDRPGNRRAGGGEYERNRSPPPPPVGGMNRERESSKRRASPGSPPPYRRHSPGRRSPPSYKRSRRDEAGGFDGRRGGFGPGDRRFGYDHGRGYDRDMGGRLQYGDDRPGRFMGRGPLDMARGGYRDGNSTQREGLMSYKQFIQELEDDILPSEAERRYQEYKSEYIATQKRTFFAAHKDEEWLKDKYHPGNLLAVIERRNELARKIAKDFLLDLQSGALDIGPAVNAASLNKSGQTNDPNSDIETDADGNRRRPNRGSTKETDLLSAAPKAHPVSSDPRRVQVDIEQAQALIRKLDSEKGIEENILRGADTGKPNRDKSHGGSGPVIIIRGLTSVKGLEGIELLDSLLTYLWRVHGVDYYGMIEINEAKGLRHVRGEAKSADASNNAAEWEKTLDSHWQDRLLGQDPLEIMTAKDKIEAAAVEALDPYVRKIRDEKYGWKYGCGAKGCTKLFHAAEFVHKHLKLKHPELATDVTTKVREELYFQNYMNDPNAPGGKPVMQQPSVRDRIQKRKFNLDNRLKDDRGNRRGRDSHIGGDRFDRGENMHSNDDGPDGIHDEPIFDDGQGMHGGPPFSSEIAPPSVLMPVPGAGPLGPFVPAPPDVAMRLLREQGGPPPFEGGGRNGRPGPQGGGPLLLSPAFRQDPRRLRSYNDLDAPEDEVTVIDYRSL
uniref:C2H2-type domain-containing protein n=1 Tax=Kalanchoe fedtschenkoi TaxID=63787 RepID=A0A7N1A2H4_KALFE